MSYNSLMALGMLLSESVELLCEKGCYGLNGVPSKFIHGSSNSPAPQNVTLVRERDFKEVIKVE